MTPANDRQSRKHMQNTRILFIDAYDSFSNSIISLLRTELLVTVECIKIDDARFVLNDEAFYGFLDGFAAVVAGPGPGHPGDAQDIGLIARLWKLPEEHVLPVLGICLGFQSLCLAFGAKVERLKEPRHGILSIVTHCGKDIFADTGKIVATQYHSLHVNLQRMIIGDEWNGKDSWKPSGDCGQLVPLAWSLMNIANGPILMGARHNQKPFWGVQYHPESVCTNREGQKLVRNWWDQVCKWTREHRASCSGPDVPFRKLRIDPAHEDVDVEDPSMPRDGKKIQTTPALNMESCTAHVQWKSLRLSGNIDIAAVTELVRKRGWSTRPAVLESGTRAGKPVNAETGRFSIVGLPDRSTTQIRYETGTGLLQVDAKGETVLKYHAAVEEAFALVDQIMCANPASHGPPQSPFWAGLVGFISYEAGLETIDIGPPMVTQGQPDIWLVFVRRSIVIDHVEGKIYIQSVKPKDDEWIGEAQGTLLKASEEAQLATPAQAPLVSVKLVDGPAMEEYCQKVRDCQSQLRAGESYELCLTDQSTIETNAAPWEMYKRLRVRNPAPFSSFLEFGSPDSCSLSVAGSSPERFLSWSREGKCQFRPIKGTVKKAEGVTRAKAEELLGSAKERAENLMIVDLIRHDLAGVAGVKDIQVPKLMSIEEYETVFQLVSVIEGDMDQHTSGSAVLAASLPPGSMTGAPKKRSCELLKEIEGDKPRGLYSGVIGYFDVGGGGDFSVVIRTAFKWATGGAKWKVGAGGAVTALSEVKAEWEEMVTKRESILKSLSC